MDVDALAKTKGGKKGGKGNDKEPGAKKFDGNFLVRCTRPCDEGLSQEGSQEKRNRREGPCRRGKYKPT